MRPSLARTTIIAFAVCAAMAALPSAAQGAGGKRELPAKFRRVPYSLMSLSVGHPNDGWQVRAKQLEPRRYLHIKKGSKKYAYAHPALVKMLYRTARDIARSTKGSIMVVGDLSAKHGGFISGHASHHSGRDADVAFYVRSRTGKHVTLDRFVAFDGDGRAKDGSGLLFDDYRNWLLVQCWLRDHRAGISHIFVSRPLRQRLLDFARSRKAFKKYVPEAEKLLKQPRDSEAHDDHFHVRISCPKRQDGLCMEHPK